MIYIHIGIAKTASSYLQYNIFNNLNILYYNEKSKSLLNYVLDPKDKLYKKLFLESELYFNFKKNKDIIISNEGLSVLYNSNNDYIASILHSIFGDFKLIILIRNQIDWIISRYNQDYKMHMSPKYGYYSINEWIRGDLHNAMGELSLCYKPEYRIRYDLILSSYLNVIQHKNILLILFEEFKNDNKKSINKISKFIKNDNNINLNTKKNVNKSLSFKYLKFNKFISYVIGKKLSIIMNYFLGRFFPLKTKEIEKIKQNIINSIDNNIKQKINNGNKQIFEKFYLNKEYLKKYKI